MSLRPPTGPQPQPEPAPDAELFELLAARRPVEVDVAAGSLRMGSAQRQVDDLAEPEQVYGAYLSLLYAVRGARRGEELPLRSADMDALLVVVGEDPELIELRLVELMGCTPDEASLLRRVLLRHRALTATVGVAAGLSLLALVGPASGDSTLRTEVAPASSGVVADSPVRVGNDSSPTADVAARVVTSPAAAQPVLPTQREASTRVAEPGPTTPAETVTVVQPTAAQPAHPPAKDVVPASSAPAEPDVVLGEPMLPIDRPGFEPQPQPQPAEPDVVLGEPMVPIDRPGFEPQPAEPQPAEPPPAEPDVVLGEPMVPIDRPVPVIPDPIIRVQPDPGTPVDLEQKGKGKGKSEGKARGK